MSVNLLLEAECHNVMIRKIDTGEFHLTTEHNEGESFFAFSETRFNILKFRKRKIEKAPKGFSIKIEQQWRNGRIKSECLPFETFRDKYLRDHAPIFLEGGATLSFVLGLQQNNAFIPIKIQSTEPLHPASILTCKIKNFKVRLYYDLYIS